MDDQELMQEESHLIATDPNHNVKVPAVEVAEEIPSEQPRRSARGSMPPIWMKDYMSN